MYDTWKQQTPPTFGVITQAKKKEGLNPKYEEYLKNLFETKLKNKKP